MGTEEITTTLSAQVVMEIAEDIGESKTYKVQRKIPEKHLTFIGGKDINGAALAAPLLILLIISFILFFMIILFFIVLVVVIVGYAAAKNNSLSLDIPEKQDESIRVILTASGEGAEKFLKDLMLKILTRERTSDSDGSKSGSAQVRGSVDS